MNTEILLYYSSLMITEWRRQITNDGHPIIDTIMISLSEEEVEAALLRNRKSLPIIWNYEYSKMTKTLMYKEVIVMEICYKIIMKDIIDQGLLVCTGKGCDSTVFLDGAYNEMFQMKIWPN